MRRNEVRRIVQEAERKAALAVRHADPARQAPDGYSSAQSAVAVAQSAATGQPVFYGLLNVTELTNAVGVLEEGFTLA